LVPLLYFFPLYWLNKLEFFQLRPFYSPAVSWLRNFIGRLNSIIGRLNSIAGANSSSVDWFSFYVHLIFLTNSFFNYLFDLFSFMSLTIISLEKWILSFRFRYHDHSILLVGVKFRKPFMEAFFIRNAKIRFWFLSLLRRIRWILIIIRSYWVYLCILGKYFRKVANCIDNHILFLFLSLFLYFLEIAFPWMYFTF
jgi:hypothetical protein